ncbi:MAG TPA: MBL fold metallo-hydrolase [Chitinophagales bacterium]|mgnify:CR=1 FL=1|nr:MBL fold metallo-hydrolase [Chitinophagales bacterium]HRK27440.1 MBL fold metallo-hydrolase [Chitinophagales bacterium]
MLVHTINTGFFKLDGGAMFGVVPKTIWQHLNPPDADNLCTWAMRCLLIETDGKRILIDTGLGNKQTDKFFSYYQPHGTDTLTDSLRQLGLTPNDITDVLLTHLHFDHVGGAVTKNAAGELVPAFPNATYWSNQPHWQWATYPNEREKASFLKENFVPLLEQNRIQWLTDGAYLCPGVYVRFVYGHTEAMMIPHIELPNGKTLVYMADLIASSAHVRIPYVMAYDVRPLQTLVEKKDFLYKAATHNHFLFFEHDPRHACATVRLTDRGNVEVAELLTLQDAGA